MLPKFFGDERHERVQEFQQRVEERQGLFVSLVVDGLSVAGLTISRYQLENSSQNSLYTAMRASLRRYFLNKSATSLAVVLSMEMCIRDSLAAVAESLYHVQPRR